MINPRLAAQYLGHCFVNTGRWHPESETLELELWCRFHEFDGLEPLPGNLSLVLGGVRTVTLKYGPAFTGVERHGAPWPIEGAGLSSWPLPAEAMIRAAIFGDQPDFDDRALQSVVLAGSPRNAGRNCVRLVLKLFHPEYSDHDVWFEIHHRALTLTEESGALDLDGWYDRYVNWIQRSTARPPLRPGPHVQESQ